MTRAVFGLGMLGSTLVSTRLSARRGPLEFREITYTTTNGVPSLPDVHQQRANPLLIYFHSGSWTDGARPQGGQPLPGVPRSGLLGADTYHFDTNRIVDPIVPYAQSVAHEAALRKAGVPVEMYTVPPACLESFPMSTRISSCNASRPPSRRSTSSARRNSSTCPTFIRWRSSCSPDWR